MAIDSAAIIAAVVADATALESAPGVPLFARVVQSEPTIAPGTGLSLAVWADRIAPVAEESGLAATAALLLLSLRIYTSPANGEAVDPAILTATDLLMAAFNGDFTLDGTVAYVDVFGKFGHPLEARAGYLNQDSKVFRVMVLALPLVITDAWEQAA